MHHAILGPGGVGGLLGACLAHAGERVTMVVRSSALASYPEQLHLESTFGAFDVAVERTAIVPSADVLWIAVKATQLDDALRSIPEPVPVDAIVPLLNGIDHIALLAQRYGRGKVIPATIAGETERIAPGRFSHPSPFERLNMAERGRAKLGTTLMQLEKIGFTCRFLADDATLMWSKLVFLAPLALASSAVGLPLGEVLADHGRRNQLQACVHEACAVASAEGATVSAEVVLTNFHALPPTIRSSMQKDLEKGNPPELDAIAGPILRGGAAHGIPVPATRELANAVARRAQAAQAVRS